ncbi:MAG TPA: response regulator transcription factor [Flavobacterium sp.]
MIRIGIADDHLLVRKSLVQLISTFREVEVVMEAEDGRQLLDVMQKGPVDVLVLDILMPHLDGFETCAFIREEYPSVKVLIISHMSSEETLRRVMGCGAHGFISKNSKPEQLDVAIKSVWNKEYYFDVDVATVLRQAIQWKEQSVTLSSLTISDREIAVIRLAAKEFSSFEIADKLNINVRTVETHRKRIMEKTHSKNFIGVILFALQHKLIRLEELSD